MTDVVVPPSTPALPPRSWHRRTLVLSTVAAAVLGAALLVPGVGMVGLIPFGLLLAFSADSADVRRSVNVTRRNLVLAAAMVGAFGWFWLWHLGLAESALMAVAGTLIALPLALQDVDDAPERTVVVTKRSLILSLMGLVTFTYVYQDGGVWFFALAAVCVVLPLVVAVSRGWAVRRGRIEFGLLHHPLRRRMRVHLVQGLNIWVCCGLLGGVVAAGGIGFARIWFSLDAFQFGLVLAAFTAGLVLLAALALVPLRRVYLTTNVAVVLLSGFLAVQLIPLTVSPTKAVLLDSPVDGEWYVQNGGRSVLLNGHLGGENNAVDLQLIGTNGRTHTGGRDASLADYAGFGMTVLAPADGRIVEVTDHYADNPPGTNSDEANHLVIAIAADRYLSMAHLQQGSVTVAVGDTVHRGQQLAAVGNNGHSSAPHLHFQVQDSPAGSNADRTYPMLFRNVHITRSGPWPWGDTRELRTGDLIRARG